MTNPDFGERTGIPRWLKLSVITGLLVAVLVVVLVLALGGGHQPRRHGPSGGDRGTAPASSVVTPGGGGVPHVRPPHR